MNILIIDDNIHFSKIIKNDVLNFFSGLYNDISIEIINNNLKCYKYWFIYSRNFSKSDNGVHIVS